MPDSVRTPSTICVSIGRGRHKHLIAEHKHLAEQGAKLVELRLDYISTAVNLRRLLPERPCPVVVTCRRERDGGKWVRSEDERLMLLRQAIVTGIEYVDLEDDVAGKVPRFGKTKRIVSYHNFDETPADLDGLHARLAALDADIVKIATMVHAPHDNVRLMRLIRGAKVPTIALGMGEIGAPSRVLAGKFGAPLTYATFQQERSMAPGQLSYQQMRDVYRYEQLNAETEVYGVIGDPVAQSLSPQVHNAAFAAANLNKVYLPFRIPPEHLATFLKDCDELGVKGLSVTIPHKEDVLQHLSRADEATQAIGACNTVVWHEGQRLGYNTDARAAMASLDALFGGKDGQSGLRGKGALVLGAGGAARAIVYGLRQRGAEVLITARTAGRADELAERFKCRAIAWNMRHSQKVQLIVNCTPVGMHPNVDESPIDPRFLDHGMTVFDTVYNPEQTLLLKQARETGCRTITGVDMFVGQAALQSQQFMGKPPAVELMGQVFRQAISAVRP